MRYARTPAQRAGFTLVELLVVLAILAILVALSAGAVMQTVNAQHRSNTRTLLNKADGEVSKQWKATMDSASKESPPYSVLQLAGNNPDRARVIWIKLRLKQEFPMSYKEALRPGFDWNTNTVIIPDSDLRGKFPELGTRTTAANPQTEMAACLLLALKKSRRGTGFNPEEAFGSGALTDTDGDGLQEIVDGWGTAIGFYRWNAGNSDLDNVGGPRLGTPPRNTDRDREDPDHLLMDASWVNTPAAMAFERLCQPLRQSAGSPAPYSWYSEPTIVSFGPDKKSGLDSFLRETTPPDVKDNLYSFKFR